MKSGKTIMCSRTKQDASSACELQDAMLAISKCSAIPFEKIEKQLHTFLKQTVFSLHNESLYLINPSSSKA